MIKRKGDKNGFAALYIALLVMAFVFAAALSVSIITLGQQRISANIVDSSQAYFAAEAGIEDALLKLATSTSWSSPYNFNVASSSVTTTISDIIGGARTVTVESNYLNRLKKMQAVYAISSDKISFHYGSQVGEGGMVMGNGSEVKGNVFSNGNIVGSGIIDNSVIVAGNGNRIESVHVKENATVHTCKNSTVDGNLTYVSGGNVQNCTVGGSTSTQPGEISSQALPISQDQIDAWKSAAAQGGVISTDVIINQTTSTGPIQIGTTTAPKNLTVNNGKTLKLNGTIYVTGNVIFNQNSIIQLESSYGSLSGVIIADGVITVENGTAISGSGQPGSYVLILSTENDVSNPVINVKNNAAGAIFYANSGLIYLKNNMHAREITGYKIQLENGAQIEYDSGLANASFSTGPGGSWEVADWKEIE